MKDKKYKMTVISENARIKYDFFLYQKEALGKSEKTLQTYRVAIHKFDKFMQNNSYRKFNHILAIKFKKTLDKYEISTKLQTLRIIRSFLIWLKDKSGFRKHIILDDICYLTPKISDLNIVTSSYKNIKFPSLKQIENVLENMPNTTDIDKRNRAFISFLTISGSRIEAAISCPISVIDIKKQIFIQDPRLMKTKFRKIIYTAFFPVGSKIINNFINWYNYLINDLGFSLCDPLFPKEIIKNNQMNIFQNMGITYKPEFYKTTNKMRYIVQKSFKDANLYEYSPHSFRHMLAQLGEKICKSPEEFKAWSQNMGHKNVSTTFTSYGQINTNNQLDIIHNIKTDR